jgi:hypothetical protein
MLRAGEMRIRPVEGGGLLDTRGPRWPHPDRRFANWCDHEECERLSDAMAAGEFRPTMRILYAGEPAGVIGLPLEAAP